jgi:hypothetical protein
MEIEVPEAPMDRRILAAITVFLDREHSIQELA